MTTDPTADLLRELAAIPPGPEPFITLYLDLRVDGNNLRPGLAYFRVAAIREARRLQGSAAALRSYEDDIERVQRYLDSDVDPAHQGLALFACGARAVFQPVSLALAPENRLMVSGAPRLFQLARLVSEYEAHCVVVLSRTRARVFTVALGKITLAAQRAQSRHHVSKTIAGGWSQGNYQRHVEHNVQHFAADVAAAVTEVFQQHQPRELILAGETVAVAELERALPTDIAGRAIRPVRFDADVPEHQVLAEVLPVLASLEAEQDQRTVEALAAEAARGELGVLGVEGTLVALEQGQVDKLVLSGAFNGAGWRCQRCLSYGTGGMPSRCPYCGSGIQEVALRESMVGAAQRTGAALEFIDGSPVLDAAGGVGAFLRFGL